MEEVQFAIPSIVAEVALLCHYGRKWLTLKNLGIISGNLCEIIGLTKIAKLLYIDQLKKVHPLKVITINIRITIISMTYGQISIMAMLGLVLGFPSRPYCQDLGCNKLGVILYLHSKKEDCQEQIP